MSPRVIARRAQMTALAASWRKKGESTGFVPTMGALHEGHAALIRRARRENDRVVVSVFVNPAQFGPKEDFSRYPRSFAADSKLCAACGADAVYHPSPDEVYPEGFATSVEVRGLSELLCGRFRPGHFRGVATVVLKLLETVRPDRAYFGEKDFQQLVIIRRMVQDLGLPVSIVGCPTVREKDGLALSSRNAYLKPSERAAAPDIYATLKLGSELATARRAGLRPARLISRLRREILRRIKGVQIDYISLVDSATLEDAKALEGNLRLLAAVWIGKTRLIDNVPVMLG